MDSSQPKQEAIHLRLEGRMSVAEISRATAEIANHKTTVAISEEHAERRDQLIAFNPRA
jgi:hypothetical protein